LKTSSSSSSNNNNDTNPGSESSEDKLIDIEEDEELGDKEKIEENKKDEEIEEEKFSLPSPPPAKIPKTRANRSLTHNVVSSTTTDEQLPDLNMFLPSTLLPPLPTSSNSSPYFPFPPPPPPPPHLSTSNPLSFVNLNTTDWLQFFRSPLFVPSTFRLPLNNIPRRFPFEFNNQNSFLTSGSHSAFKPPPLQKPE